MDYHEASPPPPPAHSVSLAPASRAGCYAPEQGIAFTMSPSVCPARQVPVFRGDSAFYVGSHSCPDDQLHGIDLFATAFQTAATTCPSLNLSPNIPIQLSPMHTYHLTAATTSPLRPSLSLSPMYTYHLTGMPPPRAQRLTHVQTVSPFYSLHRDLGLE
jgi:hypothetical protein